MTVNVNGTISSDTQAVVSIFDHGFLFGEGVYETIRTYNHQPFLFDRHVGRLRTSARLIKLPMQVSDAELLSRVTDTMSAAGELNEAYIRVLLTRGVGDLTYDPLACPTSSVVIIVKPFEPVPQEVLEQGVKITLSTVVRNHPETVSPRIKSNNLLNNALAMQEALEAGAAEALMRNYRGELAECSQSNFFIVRGGQAVTPPLDAGLLEGVTRNFLFEVGRDVGVPVHEATLWEHDLATADEAFVTSTTRSIVPVIQVGEHVVGTGTPGPITKTLMDALARKANELTLASPGARG